MPSGYGVLGEERTDLPKLFWHERDKNIQNLCPCLWHTVLRRKGTFSAWSFCGWRDFYSTALATDGNLSCYLQAVFFFLLFVFGVTSGGCVHNSSKVNAAGKKALSSTQCPARLRSCSIWPWAHPLPPLSGTNLPLLRPGEFENETLQTTILCSAMLRGGLSRQGT